MKKRGQITVFIIIGIILLFSLFFFLYPHFKDIKSLENEMTQFMEPKELNSYLKSCLENVGPNYVRYVSLSGGIYNSTKRLNYQTEHLYGKDYLFHCSWGNGCENELITRTVMEREISSFVLKGIESCLDLSAIEELGYKIKKGKPSVDANIGVREVFLTLNYPITISKGDFSMTSDDIIITIPSDLGYLYDLSVQITNGEIRNGFFDIDEWMRYNGDTIIERHRPYPFVIYNLKRFDNRTKQWLEFPFGIGGYDSAEFVGSFNSMPEKDISSWACVTDDNNCYFNVKNEAECIDPSLNNGKMVDSPAPNECLGLSNIMGLAGKEIKKEDRFLSDCGGEECKNCVDGHNHGDSWCVYDGITGGGWDYVGSRHYKQSCFNGVILTEECRDYREGICVEDPDSKENNGHLNAVCRINRWYDCALQNNKADCLDDSQRDCNWSVFLVNSDIPTYGIDPSSSPCHPMVPPGIKHWKLPYNKVCEMGSELRYCDGWECPVSMNDVTNLHCSFMGDCGAGRNVEDVLSIDGYQTMNTYTNLREGYAYLPAGEAKSTAYSLNLDLYKMDYNNPRDIEYENNDGNIFAILEGVSQFIDKASGWDECTFCNCPFGVWADSCTYDELTPFGNYCGVWQAPDGGDDCSKCDDNPIKPCTEYKCYSLGKTCQFIPSEEGGYGSCIDSNPDDVIGPEIYFDSASNSLSEVSLEEGFDPMFDMKGVVVCNGDSCDDDIDGEDGLEPYSLISVKLNLSENASCKTFPHSIFNYKDIPYIMPIIKTTGFNDSFIYQNPVIPKYAIYDLIESLTTYKSLLSENLLESVDGMITKVYNEARDLMEEFGGDVDSLDDFYTSYVSETSTPMRNFIRDYNEGFFKILTKIESDQMIEFVKCIDRSGNNQTNDYFISYTVGKDTLPPEINFVSPPNRSTVPREFNLSVWLNEPSECRWSFEDLPFNEMEFEMDCPKSFFSLRENGFNCKVKDLWLNDPDENTIFIRCLDQPRIVEYLKISLNNMGEFSYMDQLTPHFIDLLRREDYGKDMIYIASNKKRYIKNMSKNIGLNVRGPTLLNISHDWKKICKYSNDGFKTFEEMELNFCEGEICEKELNPLGSETYYIGCVNYDYNPRNEGSYFLNYEVGLS